MDIVEIAQPDFGIPPAIPFRLHANQDFVVC
jgi:hypothetical protein